jgi:hypothetical protein
MATQFMKFQEQEDLNREGRRMPPLTFRNRGCVWPFTVRAMLITDGHGDRRGDDILHPFALKPLLRIHIMVAIDNCSNPGHRSPKPKFSDPQFVMTPAALNKPKL